MDLMSVYKCQNCGDRLDDEVDRVEIIDTETDEVFVEFICKRCTGHVRPTEELQPVNHERWLWLNGYFDEERPDGEEDEDWR